MSSPPAARVYSVDTLTSEIRKLLEMSYADIWVEGEVSSLSSPPSGHLYFTLKDQNSVLKCVLFKNRRYLASALPAEGERFLIRGRVSVYTARGDVQLICSYIEAAGEGELLGLAHADTGQPFGVHGRDLAKVRPIGLDRTKFHGAAVMAQGEDDAVPGDDR